VIGVTWSAWKLDPLTWGWICWICWFIAWETLALWRYPGQELTAHLRPLFGEHPLAWWIGVGAWMWLGIHFLAPQLEARMLDWLV
jgi:hypothetical protein